jgi:hypothetical protein
LFWDVSILLQLVSTIEKMAPVKVMRMRVKRFRVLQIAGTEG